MVFFMLLNANGIPLYFRKSSLQTPRHYSLFYADRITHVWCTDTDTYTLRPPHTAKAHNTHGNSVLFLFFLLLFASILIRSKLYTKRTNTLAPWRQDYAHTFTVSNNYVRSVRKAATNIWKKFVETCTTSCNLLRFNWHQNTERNKTTATRDHKHHRRDVHVIKMK